MCDTVASFVKRGDSVRVVLHPGEATWYVQGAVLEAFIERGLVPTQSLTAPSEVELGLAIAQVEYSNIRGGGLFSAKVLDRAISVEFMVKVVEKKSGEILLHRNFVQSACDTIEASAVELMENAGIPATHGRLPEEGFFASFLEPFVTIGAIAVAVYLLFHVRS